MSWKEDIIDTVRKVYTLVNSRHKETIAHIDKRADEIIEKYASLEAFILTIADDETFKKIISANLEKSIKEIEKKDD